MGHRRWSRVGSKHTVHARHREAEPEVWVPVVVEHVMASDRLGCTALRGIVGVDHVVVELVKEAHEVVGDGRRDVQGRRKEARENPSSEQHAGRDDTQGVDGDVEVSPRMVPLVDALSCSTRSSSRVNRLRQWFDCC